MKDALAMEAAMPGELEVKASFVLNFVRLVNWAKPAQEGTGQPLLICALSKSEFSMAVQSAAARKFAGDRAIVMRIEPFPDVRKCRVLVFDRPEYPAARQVLAGIRDCPILTIGNGPGFLDAGGMFEFIVEDRTVQFDVGLTPVRRSGLDISGRLLHLSRNLRAGENSGY
jgi:hypothetical protein